MIDQTLTTPPDAPSSNDIPTFRTRFDAFIAWIVTFVSQLTTVISQINSTASTINDKEVSAVNASSVAVASANFKGTWNILSSVKANDSYVYNGVFYRALHDSIGQTPPDSTTNYQNSYWVGYGATLAIVESKAPKNSPLLITPSILSSNGQNKITFTYSGNDNKEFDVGGVITIGSVIICSSQIVPSGYLECNGALLSRTTYAKLFDAIGTTFGAGDGSTTFAIPDLRGEFIRGWDNGRGIDAGRAIGTKQGDAIRNITGSVAQRVMGITSGSGAISVTSTASSLYGGGGGTGGILSFDASLQVPTASENRPRNVSFMFCIKY